MGLVKLGQPQSLSNLSIEVNNGSPDTMSTYKPASLLSQNSFLKGRSVPFRCVTSYCSGDRREMASALLRYLGIVFAQLVGFWQPAFVAGNCLTRQHRRTR